MRRLLPVLAVVAVSSCGSASHTAATTTETTTRAATTAKTPAPAKPARTQVVSIKNFDFHPKTLTVAAGTTVRWMNRDTANHTVTGEDGAKIKLGNVNPGKTVQMRFTTPRTYKYYCEYHLNMHARIVVR